MNKPIVQIVAALIVLSSGIYFLSKGNSLKISETERQLNESQRNYDIEVTQKPSSQEIKIGDPATIKYKIKDDRGEILKDFAIAHEKLMHFIVVRKDLEEFQHLHPEINKETGEFSVDLAFPSDGPYRFFADFTPEKENPQKLPITVFDDLAVGNTSSFQPYELVVDEGTTKKVPPKYDVTYSFTDKLLSQSPLSYSVVVESNGQSVVLQKYLGALGHSVILKEKTLAYIHTHAGDARNTSMDGMDHSQMGHTKPSSEQSANQIDFSTTFPEPGKYKIFTQFQHERKVLTTDYVVSVQ